MRVRLDSRKREITSARGVPRGLCPFGQVGKSGCEPKLDYWIRRMPERRSGRDAGDKLYGFGEPPRVARSRQEVILPQLDSISRQGSRRWSNPLGGLVNLSPTIPGAPSTTLQGLLHLRLYGFYCWRDSAL